MKTIGIVGTRSRNTPRDLLECKKKFIEIYEDGDRIVSGGCPKGGDRFAEAIARSSQIPITVHYAQWHKLGKGAGFARNKDIAEDCDVLIAVVSDDRTGGTEHTISLVDKMDKPVHLI